MRRILKIALWTLVAVIFIGTFVYLFLNSRPKQEVYDLVSPSTATIERSTVLTGTIEPRDEIDIKPQISGIISEICVEAGQLVANGDIIAKIKIVPDESTLAQADSRIQAARIALTDAETRHNRNASLYDRKVISREEFEATQTEVAKAREELQAAQEQYAIVRDGASPKNATQSNTLVRATTSGVVLDIPVKVGASVIQANNFNDGTTIATIADMNNLIFKGTVDETEVGTLRVGQPLEITIGALPDLKLTADLEFISPKSTSESGANTFEVKAGINVPQGVALRSGYSANAALVLARAENVMAVPESVVEFAGDSAFVYLATDSTGMNFKRTPISTGISDGLNIEVKNGLSPKSRLRGAVKSDENKPAGPPMH